MDTTMTTDAFYRHICDVRAVERTYSIETVADACDAVGGEHAERWRRWMAQVAGDAEAATRVLAEIIDLAQTYVWARGDARAPRGLRAPQSLRESRLAEARELEATRVRLADLHLEHMPL